MRRDGGCPPRWPGGREASVCVVAASGGYPGPYETGVTITGVEEAGRLAGVTVFHAGTARRDGALVTAGGRVLGVQALGGDIAARHRPGLCGHGSRIAFPGMHVRRDIGRRAVGRPVTRVIAVDAGAPTPARLDEAAAVLRRGGLVAFPTESFYGLGADALEAVAVARVFSAKGRPETRPVLVLVDSIAMAERLVADLPDGVRALMVRHWPGPLTLVLTARPHVPAALTAGSGTVGCAHAGSRGRARARARRGAPGDGAEREPERRSAAHHGGGGPHVLRRGRRPHRGRRPDGRRHGLHHGGLHDVASAHPPRGADRARDHDGSRA